MKTIAVAVMKAVNQLTRQIKVGSLVGMIEIDMWSRMESAMN